MPERDPGVGAEGGMTDAERLSATAEGTTDDGTVEAMVLDWERVGGADGASVELELLLPSGSRESVTLDWPEADSRSYEFVRVVETTGWDLAAADRIVGEHVPVDPTGEAVSVRPDATPYERARDLVTTNAFRSVLLVGGAAGAVAVTTVLILPNRGLSHAAGTALMVFAAQLVFGIAGAFGLAAIVGLLLELRDRFPGGR